MVNTKRYAKGDRRDYDPDDPVVNPRDLVDPSEQFGETKRKRVNARRRVERNGNENTVLSYHAPTSDGYDPLLKPPAKGLAIDTMPRPLKPPGRAE
jgi:hypothetical protein